MLNAKMIKSTPTYKCTGICNLKSNFDSINNTNKITSFN